MTERHLSPERRRRLAIGVWVLVTVLAAYAWFVVVRATIWGVQHNGSAAFWTSVVIITALAALLTRASLRTLRRLRGG
ncbi:MAG: hypothetical protein ACJ768_14080 [Gaiellaceae bacterium]